MDGRVFWFIAGIGSVWLWHHFVSPVPGAKTG